jgi:hypothetical protein
MTNQAQMEALSTAFDAHTRARIAATTRPSRDTFKAEHRAINALEDACVDAGMRRGFSDMEGWAACRLAKWWEAA